MLSVAVHASGVSGTVRDGGAPAAGVVLPSRRKARPVVRHRKLGGIGDLPSGVSGRRGWFDQSPDERSAGKVSGGACIAELTVDTYRPWTNQHSENSPARLLCAP